MTVLEQQPALAVALLALCITRTFVGGYETRKGIR